MLLLVDTNDKIQLTSSSAANLDVVCAMMDHTLTTDNVEGKKQLTAISSATTTDIVAAPASGDVRNVKTIHVRNKHASTSNDVTIIFDDNGTDYELFKCTLRAGEHLEYVEGIGFFVVAYTTKLDTKLRVSSDVANATTSFADITGLTCPVESGKHYCFEAHINHIENASTTGARFAINGPAMTAMRLTGFGLYTGSLTAAVMFGPTADVSAVDTAVTGVTLNSTTTPQVALFIMSGWINPSAAGTLAFRSQSEIAVAAGVTVKAGSWARVWESDN